MNFIIIFAPFCISFYISFHLILTKLEVSAKNLFFFWFVLHKVYLWGVKCNKNMDSKYKIFAYYRKGDHKLKIFCEDYLSLVLFCRENELPGTVVEKKMSTLLYLILREEVPELKVYKNGNYIKLP